MCESFSRETYVCMYGPRQPAAGGIAYVYILTMNVARRAWFMVLRSQVLSVQRDLGISLSLSLSLSLLARVAF